MANNFQHNLNYLLSVRNVRQKKLAELLGDVKPSTVNGWVKGVSIPGINTMIEIAALLNVSLDELVLDTLGDPLSQYDQFARNNQVGSAGKKAKENSSTNEGNASNKEGKRILLNEELFQKTDEIGELVLFLNEDVERLRRHPLMKLFVNKIEKEAVIEYKEWLIETLDKEVYTKEDLIKLILLKTTKQTTT